MVIDGADAEPGGEVTVRGGGYEPGAVALRWGGLRGERLGTAQAGTDGRFTTTVRLLDAGAGRHQRSAADEGRGLDDELARLVDDHQPAPR